MSTAIVRRRKKKRTLKARVRQNMFILAFFAVLAAWGITYAVTWPGFHPKGVGVSGNHVVTPQAVRVAAHIERDENIWLINPWTLTARVMAIPYVDTATLERKLPNIVTVAITERKPDSCVRGVHGATMMIDARGRVLEMRCKVLPLYVVPRLPPVKPGNIIANDELARLRGNASLLIAAGMQLRSVITDRDGGMVVARKDGIRLLLGDDADYQEKARLVAPVLEAARKHGGHVVQVDLRAPSTPVVRYRETSHTTLNARTKE